MVVPMIHTHTIIVIAKKVTLFLTTRQWKRALVQVIAVKEGKSYSIGCRNSLGHERGVRVSVRNATIAMVV